jgi:hypothetical protein
MTDEQIRRAAMLLRNNVNTLAISRILKIDEATVWNNMPSITARMNELGGPIRTSARSSIIVAKP